MRILHHPGRVFEEAALVGASTLVIGMAMNKGYRYFGWNVPEPVFWALLGVWTHLAWEVIGANREMCLTARFDP